MGDRMKKEGGEAAQAGAGNNIQYVYVFEHVNSTFDSKASSGVKFNTKCQICRIKAYHCLLYVCRDHRMCSYCQSGLSQN